MGDKQKRAKAKGTQGRKPQKAKDTGGPDAQGRKKDNHEKELAQP